MKAFIGRLPEQNRAGQFRGSGGRLDPETALPGEPEKSGGCGIKPDHRQTVRCKAAQASPFPAHPFDLHIHRFFKPVDRDRNAQFVRCHIAGLGRDFVVRAEPIAATRFRLEIETAIQTNDQRHVGRGRRIGFDLNHIADQRLDTDRFYTSHAGDGVRPGTRCIDQHGRVIACTAGAQFPAVILLQDLGDRRAADQIHRLASGISQIGGMEAGDINVAAIRLIDHVIPYRFQVGDKGSGLLPGPAVHDQIAVGKIVQKPVG